MYICICNPFSDKSVQRFLKDKNQKVTVASVYKECSGGEKPQCGTCLDTVKDLVREHNSKVTVDSLKTRLPETELEKE
jgi:bacterioferritin-associated ferredoxin